MVRFDIVVFWGFGYRYQRLLRRWIRMSVVDGKLFEWRRPQGLGSK